jgi:hypothetical protein
VRLPLNPCMVNRRRIHSRQQAYRANWLGLGHIYIFSIVYTTMAFFGCRARGQLAISYSAANMFNFLLLRRGLLFLLLRVCSLSLSLFLFLSIRTNFRSSSSFGSAFHFFVESPLFFAPLGQLQPLHGPRVRARRRDVLPSEEDREV